MATQVNEFMQLIKNEINKYAVLKQLSDKFEERTHVNSEFVVLGAIVLVFLMLFSGIGASFVCHLTAFIYPFYSTLVVLSAPEKGPTSQFWLVYWVTYATLSVFENICGFLLHYLPLYYPFKFTFILWLSLPKFKGAEVIYQKLILPTFKEHESTVDEAIRKVDKNIVK